MKCTSVYIVISNVEEDKVKVYGENFYIEKVHNLLDLYTQHFYILTTHPHTQKKNLTENDDERARSWRLWLCPAGWNHFGEVHAKPKKEVMTIIYWGARRDYLTSRIAKKN